MLQTTLLQTAWNHLFQCMNVVRTFSQSLSYENVLRSQLSLWTNNVKLSYTFLGVLQIALLQITQTPLLLWGLVFLGPIPPACVLGHRSSMSVGSWGSRMEEKEDDSYWDSSSSFDPIRLRGLGLLIIHGKPQNLSIKEISTSPLASTLRNPWLESRFWGDHPQFNWRSSLEVSPACSPLPLLLLLDFWATIFTLNLAGEPLD